MTTSRERIAALEADGDAASSPWPATFHPAGVGLVDRLRERQGGHYEIEAAKGAVVAYGGVVEFSGRECM